ncbi:hypothetical protein YTPLAS73_02610 [Nitrosarchaeum sp.]|nr:hypothetical protein YTPLAS73_02610 [Nitrosarchaeum sp.]
MSLFTFELTSSLLHNLWKRFGWDANYPAIGINDSILQLCLTQNFSLLVNTTQGGFGITPSNIRKVIAKNWLYRTTRTGIKIHAIPVNLFERETRFLDNLKHGSLTNFFDVQ